MRIGPHDCRTWNPFPVVRPACNLELAKGLRDAARPGHRLVGGNFALAYAKQKERDYDALVAARTSGRIVVSDHID